MTNILSILKLSAAIFILIMASKLWTPALANYRGWIIWGTFAVNTILIVSEIVLRKTKLVQKVLSFAILAIAVLAVVTILFTGVRRYQIEQNVLNSDENKLEELGQHFIVGYKDVDELTKLVERKAIGGIFITTRNIQHKTAAEIETEIDTLQAIRQTQGLSPLWVATDQEGGGVSRLSPPLTQLPPLAKIVAQQQTESARQQAVAQYAEVHGKELSEVGVNLNFAPVVDLNKGIINPKDKYSQIYRRAIASDKNIVAVVALQYCRTLEKYGVGCTIKHFPGLGRVEADTHITQADLHASVDELAHDDWFPFRYVIENSQAWMMLSHVRLVEMDAKHPVSFSRQVVTELLRERWQYDGILVTDDFCMQAVYNSKAGVEAATVEAINAGVDLILVAFDSDLYYPTMYALLKAKKAGVLNEDLLQQSHTRLARRKR